ncbi:MAG: fumarate hydratase [Candidatus Omnitrophota bacterium]|nr:MAG: fumarate hydratase [Candidatus Omnitrophota bacterium]
MRKVSVKIIEDKVKSLSIKVNTHLRPDVLSALKKALRLETKTLARKALNAIIKNAEIAQEKSIAICQDTGLPVVFLELGAEVYIGQNITEIIINSVAQAYRQGCLRASLQRDPILRQYKPEYKPAIVHTDIVNGGKIKISLLPKGFGSENKAQVKMFNPTSSWDEISDFIVQSVALAGASACPPYIIGIGIGGTQDFACLLAKKALLLPIDKKSNAKIAAMETNLLQRINKLKIGAMGLGGKITCLGIKILTHPTHIAGLPAAVNISCHALRSGSVVI